VLAEIYTIVPEKAYTGIETALDASTKRSYRPDRDPPASGSPKPYDDLCPGKFRCVKNTGNGEECLPGKKGGCAHGLRQFCETGYSCCLCTAPKDSSSGGESRSTSPTTDSSIKASVDKDISISASMNVGIGSSSSSDTKSSASNSPSSSSSSTPSYSSSPPSSAQQSPPSTTGSIQVSSYSNIINTLRKFL